MSTRQGLFTAHVTGNFVSLGASLVLGTSGAVAKLLALPVFCAVVVAVRLLSSALTPRWRSVFEVMLDLKVLLLIVGAALAIEFGPFKNGDTWQAVITGMVLVAAMAIQNAAHRVSTRRSMPVSSGVGASTQSTVRPISSNGHNARTLIQPKCKLPCGLTTLVRKCQTNRPPANLQAQ